MPRKVQGFAQRRLSPKWVGTNYSQRDELTRFYKYTIDCTNDQVLTRLDHVRPSQM
jgi:hypothetical protein